VPNNSESYSWAAIQEGANGITRTLYGVILLAFAFFETLTNLGFTLALGFLLLSLIIAVLFAFFTPFEGMFSSILKKLAELFMQSWAISAIQALLLAAVVRVATTSGGTATLGMGVVALFLQGLFTMIAYKTVIGSVTGLGLGGGLRSFEATRLLSPARTLAGGAVGSAFGAATAAPRMAMAAQAARQSGASGAFQRAYALSSTKPGAALGALAAAMGVGGAEFVAGAAQAQTARRYDTGMTSPLARQQIASHVERRQEQQHRAADRSEYLQERQRRAQERTARETPTAIDAPLRARGVPPRAGALHGLTPPDTRPPLPDLPRERLPTPIAAAAPDPAPVTPADRAVAVPPERPSDPAPSSVQTTRPEPAAAAPPAPDRVATPSPPQAAAPAHPSGQRRRKRRKKKHTRP
jgi:hypothetical protein